MRLNPTMTVEEYAKHREVSKVTVYDWLKKGMRKCSVGRRQSLRIDPVLADAWYAEWKSGKQSKLTELICRLKFALKSQIIPLALAAILLILVTENVASRPRQASELSHLRQEVAVISAENRELQAVLSGYAEMQARYAGLNSISDALALDIDAALSEMETDTVPSPELVLATALDSADSLAQYLAEIVEQDRQKIEEFGERVEAVPSLWPLKDGVGRITSGYGWRRRIFRLTNLWDRDGVLYEFHAAVDIAAPRGTEIVATAPGEVIAAEQVESYGLLIIIDHGYGYETWYAHLSEFKVHPGDQVERGDVIGIIGETGSSTGIHLHYEVRVEGVPVNPLPYIQNEEAN